MPQHDRLPFVERTAGLGENHKRSVPTGRLEAAVQNFGHVTQPSGAARADEVLATQEIEIFALRLLEIPRSKDSVSLGNHRALDYGEGRHSSRPSGRAHESSALAYGTHGAPLRPR